MCIEIASISMQDFSSYNFVNIKYNFIALFITIPEDHSWFRESSCMHYPWHGTMTSVSGMIWHMTWAWTGAKQCPMQCPVSEKKTGFSRFPHERWDTKEQTDKIVTEVLSFKSVVEKKINLEIQFSSLFRELFLG